MPTIELVCVAQAEPLDVSSLPFAVLAENKLLSHRALFQSDFDKLQGCIYHLGNPNLRGDEDGLFWAYELISDSTSEHEEDCLKFNDEFIPHVKKMLSQLLVASPVGQMTFSSDWQFGTKDVRRFEAITEGKFWEMHDACELRFNAFYKIVK
jgi:hypothetical protein